MGRRHSAQGNRPRLPRYGLSGRANSNQDLGAGKFRGVGLRTSICRVKERMDKFRRFGLATPTWEIQVAAADVIGLTYFGIRFLWRPLNVLYCPFSVCAWRCVVAVAMSLRDFTCGVARLKFPRNAKPAKSLKRTQKRLRRPEPCRARTTRRYGPVLGLGVGIAQAPRLSPTTFLQAGGWGSRSP